VYAMKSIHLSRVTDPAFVEELKNEIQILRSLDHPRKYALARLFCSAPRLVSRVCARDPRAHVFFFPPSRAVNRHRQTDRDLRLPQPALYRYGALYWRGPLYEGPLYRCDLCCLLRAMSRSRWRRGATAIVGSVPLPHDPDRFFSFRGLAILAWELKKNRGGGGEDYQLHLERYIFHALSGHHPPRPQV
jgi:hypothetical protein